MAKRNDGKGRIAERPPVTKHWEPIEELVMRGAINEEDCPCELEGDTTANTDWAATADLVNEVVRFRHRSGSECSWQREPSSDMWKPIRFNRLPPRGRS